MVGVADEVAGAAVLAPIRVHDIESVLCRLQMGVSRKWCIDGNYFRGVGVMKRRDGVGCALLVRFGWVCPPGKGWLGHDVR